MRNAHRAAEFQGTRRQHHPLPPAPSAEGIAMVQVLFSVANETTTTDNQPVEFPTIGEALAQARAIATELGANRPASELKGLVLRVTDQAGREIYRTPLVNQQRRVKADDIGRELAGLREPGG